MARNSLPEFHPQTVLRDWGNGEGFRLADALTGVCVFGATGSGKTSGPAKHLAYGYLAAGFGGLVLCAKKEERRQWQKWAAETGRTDDLVIVDASGQMALQFPRMGGQPPRRRRRLHDQHRRHAGRNRRGDFRRDRAEEGGGGTNKFWEDALHHMNTNLVDLPLLAGLEVSLPLLRSHRNDRPIQPGPVERCQMAEGQCLCGNFARGGQGHPESRRRNPRRLRGMPELLAEANTPICPKKPAASSP